MISDKFKVDEAINIRIIWSSRKNVRNKMLQNSLVRKDNRIINACYQLTLNEQRLILTAIAKVKYGAKIPREIDIEAHEFLQAFPDIGEKNVHMALQEAVDKLFERVIRVEDPIKKKKFRWISAATTYKQGDGKVGFNFSPEIIPYLEDLHDKFTKYRLGDVSGLKSTYSIRLFEMLTQFETTGIVLVDVDKFKERMGVEDKYKDFIDLKRRVIDPAVKELNAKSTLNINYKIERERKTAKKLVFLFSNK